MHRGLDTNDRFGSVYVIKLTNQTRSIFPPVNSASIIAIRGK